METLAVVVNVFQVLDFAFKAVEICYDFYKLGTTISIQSISEASFHLAQTTAALKSSLSAAQSHGSPTKRDTELAALARRVQDAADSLRDELKPFQIPPGSRAAVRTAIILRLRTSRIEQSRKRLDGLVKVLDTKVLVHMSQDIKALALQQGDILTIFDDRQREIISALATGTATMKQLAQTLSDQTNRHVTQEHLATRSCIGGLDKKIDVFGDFQAQRIEFERFLSSLYVPELHRRHRMIEDAHEKTFEWIFEDNYEPSRNSPSFVDWLRNDDYLFWILGKPASGKTTLMNLLVQDGRTQEALSTNGYPTVILSFSFWRGGGADLHNFQVDLLLSLMYQLLRSMEKQRLHQIWVDVIRPHTSNIPQDWTYQPLLRLLRLLIENDTRHLCLFLDGLDEYLGEISGTHAIVDLFNLFKSQPRVKICVSSRPRVDLRPFYANCPKIIMQTMTGPDIRRYANDKLSRLLVSNSATPEQASQLIEKVVLKAEGVFLWVTMAVDSLLRGINMEDRWNILEKRVDRLPERVTGLYTHMWDSIAADLPIYAGEAALCLHVVQRYERPSLMDIAILIDDGLHDLFSIPVPSWGMPQLNAEVHYQRAENRMETFSGGFVEVAHSDMNDIDEEDQLLVERLHRSVVGLRPTLIRNLCEYSRIQRSTFVTFVHGTAVDYLHTDRGQTLLRACQYTERDLIRRYLSSILISFTLAPPSAQWWQMYWRFEHVRIPLLSSQQAVTFLLRLEDICRKLFEWKFWVPEHSDFPREPHSADDIDYAKVFMTFSHPDYIQKKLDETSKEHQRDYLTHLIRWWAWTSIRYCRFEEIINNGLLLLRLGADPNQSVLESKAHPLTIWLYLLYAVLGDVGREDGPTIATARELIRELLTAGADPNGQMTSVLGMQTTGQPWKEISEPNLSTPFILSRWSARDILNSSPDSNSSVMYLFDQVGAVCAEKRSVWFEPPNVWRVLPVQSIGACDLTENWDFGQLSSGFFFSIDDETLLEILESRKGRCHAFTNGATALKAAGWTDHEIRNEPCLETVWMEIEQTNKSEQLRTEEGLSLATAPMCELPRSRQAVTV